MQLDKSSVTVLVDRAEERGPVSRIPSPVDGRSVHVAITAAGRRLVGRATAAFQTEIAALVTDLSPSQQDQLSRLASRLVATDARRRGVELFETTTAGKKSVGANRSDSGATRA